MIYIEKDSDSEYSAVIDGIMAATYIVGNGAVLYSSEGSPISLDDLSSMIRRFRAIERREGSG